MEIKLEQKNETNALIHIAVSENDYQSKLNKKLEDYRRQASIKGFRPGKAPMSLVKKMIGKEVKMDEVNDVVTRSVNDYIRDEKLELLGAPIPQAQEDINWTKEKEFNFSYEIGLVPSFEYSIDGLEADKYAIKITDEEVNKYIENLQERFGGVENPEESQKGDFVYGEIYQLKEGMTAEEDDAKSFSVTTLIPTNKVAESELEKFVGVKNGDKITFDMEKTLPNAKERGFALGIEEDAGEALSGEFVMEVESITRRKPAELNEEFFTKIMGPAEEDAEPRTEEDLKKHVLGQLKDNYDKEADALTDIMILRKVVDSTAIDLPDEFLKRWLEHSNAGEVSREQIEEEYDAFVREMKWSLIQNRILRDNEVEVTPEDIKSEARKEVQSMMMRMGGGIQMGEDQLNAMAENFLQAENGKHYQSIATQAIRQRAMETIKEKANLNDKEITEDEFAKIAEDLQKG